MRIEMMCFNIEILLYCEQIHANAVYPGELQAGCIKYRGIHRRVVQKQQHF